MVQCLGSDSHPTENGGPKGVLLGIPRWVRALLQGKEHGRACTMLFNKNLVERENKATYPLYSGRWPLSCIILTLLLFKKGI